MRAGDEPRASPARGTGARETINPLFSPTFLRFVYDVELSRRRS
jgi:hypothetical protein